MNGTSSSSPSSPSSPQQDYNTHSLPHVQLTLSRSSYQLGSAVVGTIRIHCDDFPTSSSSSSSLSSQPSLRSVVQSVVVYVAGFCRIDPRLHTVSHYAKLYGSTHPQLEELATQFDVALLPQGAGGTVSSVGGATTGSSNTTSSNNSRRRSSRSHTGDNRPPSSSSSSSSSTTKNNDTVCFWATQPLELLHLPERTVGAYQNTPFRQSQSQSQTKNRHNQYRHPPFLPPQQLAFTFRVDLPLDLPHSISAVTCRYFYSAEVLVKTETQQTVVKAPFLVTTNPHIATLLATTRRGGPLGREDNANNANKKKHSGVTARVKIGLIQAMAHSNGLPCHLSATEIHRPKGQMTTIQQQQQEQQQQYNHQQQHQQQHQQRPSSSSSSFWGGPSHPYGGEPKLQTLRVSNARGQPVCVMTIVGASILTPGSRIHIKWDFPIAVGGGWQPCYQVSACLQGQELAVYEDGTTKRTRSLIFDTCHDYVDPGVTDRVAKSLLLPVDAPCTLQPTDVMELSIQIQVDITVKDDTSGSSGYNNLRLEIPCLVVHSLDITPMTTTSHHGNGYGGYHNHNHGEDEPNDHDNDNENNDNNDNNHHGRLQENYDDDEWIHMTPLEELLFGKEASKKRPFPTHDILNDLKILALTMQQSIQNEQEQYEENMGDVV